MMIDNNKDNNNKGIYKNINSSNNWSSKIQHHQLSTKSERIIQINSNNKNKNMKIYYYSIILKVNIYMRDHQDC